MQDIRPRQFNMLPDVVKNLMIINGLFYLATLTATQFQIDLVRILGLHYVHSQYFEPYQFVSHMFMHGGMLHIFSNMFALWMFGSVLENVWGPKRFLFFYLFTGMGAALIHSGVTYYELHSLENAVNEFSSSPTPVAFKQFVERYAGGFNKAAIYDFITQWSYHEDSASYISEAKSFANKILSDSVDIPTVGASGAVFGVLLAFGMLFPNTLLYIYFFFPIKAKYFIFIYAAFEFYAGWKSVTGSSATNIAHFAHLGGMLFAYLLIKFWQKNSNRFY
jgi:membrane associated rhomboid family serine protease